ncbi:NAD-dependent epimerase/dehydratase family protein [Streptomyces sp. NPDC002994]|uniref:NAD-dependent epimerase/dehydratase family protein n=1 Tax=Streptomyces sp. NPDC002994 TaxID=3154441 RepID=UPI00339EBB73
MDPMVDSAGGRLDPVDPETVSPQSLSAFRDYLAVRHRTIRLPDQAARRRIGSRTVLVTGAAGCIGRALLRELHSYAPARIVGVGLEEQPRLPDATQYHCLDIRDGPGLTALLRQVRPDLVFHLAAQRDPGLAEREAALTITTNVLGTAHVIEACAAAGTGQLVYASTGKALRPYTSDVYAQSKRTGEWLVADAAARGIVPGTAGTPLSTCSRRASRPSCCSRRRWRRWMRSFGCMPSMTWAGR